MVKAAWFMGLVLVGGLVGCSKEPSQTATPNIVTSTPSTPTPTPSSSSPSSKPVLISNAKTSPNLLAFLNQIYGRFSEAQNCWVVHDDSGDQQPAPFYCMQIDKIKKVVIDEEIRLYVTLYGSAVDENGENAENHIILGRVGAFVFQENDHQLNVIAASPLLEMGSFGRGPADWQLVKVGSDHYYGWINQTGDMHQGYSGTWHHVLAPHGKNIKDLGGFVSSYDDSGTGQCEDACTELDTKIEFDATDTNANAQVFPLKITLTGNVQGKAIQPKMYNFEFDIKKWTYKIPNHYMLKDKEF